MAIVKVPAGKLKEDDAQAETSNCEVPVLHKHQIESIGTFVEHKGCAYQKRIVNFFDNLDPIFDFKEPLSFAQRFLIFASISLVL